MSLLRAVCLSNLGTSALYGMVLSLLGGRNSHQSRANPWHNPNSIWSIFLPIQANPVPIRCQSDVIPRSTFRSNINSPISKTWSIRANPSKSDANPSQSNANFMPLLRAICLDNLGTSPLYGMVPTQLGGQSSCHPGTTQCQSWVNRKPILAQHQEANLKPVLGQSLANPKPILSQPDANPEPTQKPI